VKPITMEVSPVRQDTFLSSLVSGSNQSMVYGATGIADRCCAPGAGGSHDMMEAEYSFLEDIR
jgi:hypothetical protein